MKVSILNALIVSLSTDMSVWEAWIERGGGGGICIVAISTIIGAGCSMSVWEAWIEGL